MNDLATDPPNKLTNEQVLAELMKEVRGGRDQIAEKVFNKLRVQNPPPANGWLKYQNIVATVMAASFAFLAAAYWRSIDASEATSKLAREAQAGVEIIQKDRTARIADLDQWRQKVEDELKVYRVGYSDFRKLEGVVAQLDGKLDSGRSERLSDRDKMFDAINNLKTEVALLRQSVEARGRRADDAPFDRNQRWTAPPWPRRPPLILKAIYGEGDAGLTLRVGE